MGFRAYILAALTFLLTPSLAFADKIQFAGYGLGRSSVDVTARVQELYDRGQRTFKASNDLFGDPAPGEDKYLVIWYQVNGQDRAWIAAEDDDETAARLPNELTERPTWDGNGYVRFAAYGLGDRACNATPWVNYDQSTWAVGANNSLCGDPWPGETKVLFAVFKRYRGGIRVDIAREGSTLSFARGE